MVLRIDSAHTCVLLPGDVPASVERTLVPRLAPCDVLKLAHHGSASSSDPAWLDALRPRIAIASVGRRASPLPHRDVRRRLRARGTEIWETWRSGALRITLHPHGPRIDPFLGPWRSGGAAGLEDQARGAGEVWGGEAVGVGRRDAGDPPPVTSTFIAASFPPSGQASRGRSWRCGECRPESDDGKEHP